MSDEPKVVVVNGSVVSWREFREMRLYQQFVVVMMLAFAGWMGVVTALFAANGEAIAAGTFVVALGTAVAALTVVPARLGVSE